MVKKNIIFRNIRANKASGHVTVLFPKHGPIQLSARARGISEGTFYISDGVTHREFPMETGTNGPRFQGEVQELSPGRLLAAIVGMDGQILLAGESHGAPENWIRLEYRFIEEKQKKHSISRAEIPPFAEVEEGFEIRQHEEHVPPNREAVKPPDAALNGEALVSKVRASQSSPSSPITDDKVRDEASIQMEQAMDYDRLEWEEAEGNEPPCQAHFGRVRPTFVQGVQECVERLGEQVTHSPSPDLSSPGWRPLHTYFQDIPPAREVLPPQAEGKTPVEPTIYDNLSLEDERSRWIPRKATPLSKGTTAQPTPMPNTPFPMHPPELGNSLSQWKWRRVEYETGDGFYYYLGTLFKKDLLIGLAVAIPFYGDANIPSHLHGFQQVGQCWVLAQDEETGRILDIP